MCVQGACVGLLFEGFIGMTDGGGHNYWHASRISAKNTNGDDDNNRPTHCARNATRTAKHNCTGPYPREDNGRLEQRRGHGGHNRQVAFGGYCIQIGKSAFVVYTRARTMAIAGSTLPAIPTTCLHTTPSSSSPVPSNVPRAYAQLAPESILVLYLYLYQLLHHLDVIQQPCGDALRRRRRSQQGMGVGVGVRGRAARPKRASIRPLVIVKPPVRVVCDDDDGDDDQPEGEGERGYVGLGLKYRLPSEVVVTSKPHSFVRNELEEEVEGEDYESLNEWYTEQLSSVVTLHSASSPHPSHTQSQPQPQPPKSHSQVQVQVQVPTSPTHYAPARPDSIFMLSPLPRFSFVPAPTPTPAPAQLEENKDESECAEAAEPEPEPESAQNRNRNAKPLPEIPAILVPSDSTLLPPRERTVVSGTTTGSVLGLLESAGLAPFVLEREGAGTGRKENKKKNKEYRAPPRSSVPVDLGMDEWVHHHHHPPPPRRSNDASGHKDVISPAPAVDLGEFTIEEEDLPLKFPVSLPTSPVDMETEFGVELSQSDENTLLQVYNGDKYQQDFVAYKTTCNWASER
ncbi:hypothetical protein PILCRDRAFT_86820 [Piloderma croceum F 1598]|uniref:Uncharacterized protein n=1 Tax=Piloderma croceum (strain F 1598) TaxID=765440 RepID=A0A0C3FP41_PILCF|nr:hypothetical protein PILCRDRAFT_86820 [Piloderma croceum F 1598]